MKLVAFAVAVAVSVVAAFSVGIVDDEQDATGQWS